MIKNKDFFVDKFTETVVENMNGISFLGQITIPEQNNDWVVILKIIF